MIMIPSDLGLVLCIFFIFICCLLGGIACQYPRTVRLRLITDEDVAERVESRREHILAKYQMANEEKQRQLETDTAEGELFRKKDQRRRRRKRKDVIDQELRPSTAPMDQNPRSSMAPIDQELRPSTAPMDQNPRSSMAPIDQELRPSTAPIDQDQRPSMALMESSLSEEELL